MPLRVVELLVAMVLLPLPWGRAVLLWWPVLLLVAAAWTVWMVADPMSMRRADARNRLP